MTHKEIPALYALKGICALMVVLIHTGCFFKGPLMPLLRTAVPVFFMISGYFLVGRTGTAPRERLLRQMKKCGGYLIGASLVYLAYRVVTVGINVDGHWERVRWMKLLLPRKGDTGDTVAWYLLGNPYCEALWYLTAYLEALLVLYLATGWIRLRRLYLLIPAGVLTGVALGRYNPVALEPFYYRNFWTMALPGVLTGMFLKQHEARLVDWLGHHRGICLGVVLLAFGEYEVLNRLHFPARNDLILTTLPLAFLVMTAFVGRPQAFRGTYMAHLGKWYSLPVYLYHLLIRDILLLPYWPFALASEDMRALAVLGVIGTGCLAADGIRRFQGVKNKEKKNGKDGNEK